MIRSVQTLARRQARQLPKLFIARPAPRTIQPVRLFSHTCIRPKEDEKGWQKVGQFKVDEKPRYSLTFTCKKCTTRSSHEVSKQSYHNGTVLIQCPGCKNRHLIADHLKIFSDQRITLEDILKTKGQELSRGNINAQDLEDTQDLEWDEIPKAIADKMSS